MKDFDAWNRIKKSDPGEPRSSEPESLCAPNIPNLPPDVSITQLQKRALEIRQKYDELNLKTRGQKWTAKDHAMGFVGDVGDLMKLVAAKEGVRRATDIDSRLGHELADCLWSVFVLADHYDIDVAQEFERTMNYLEKRITGEMK